MRDFFLFINQSVGCIGERRKAKVGENRHRRRDGVARKGHRTTTRAVCAEILSLVHGIVLGNWAIGYRLLGDEALAKADLLKLLTQEMQISCVFGLKYHKIFLMSHKVLGRLI